tara:strand:+ start:994 stop:1878 length:885 start_codon:yes stop_codon:yes gene_type:complete
MNIVICSRGERGLSCIDYLIKKKFNLLLVAIQYNEINHLKLKKIRLCKTNNIQWIITKNINNQTSAKKIRNINPEFLILAGFNQILKNNLLKIPKITINLHAGKLPKYRGGSPLNWQIINNEKKIYLTILTANKGIDTGEIIYEENFALNKSMTILEVQKKVIEKFPKMLVKVLSSFKFYFERRKKQAFSKSYFKQRKARDGEVNFSMPALLIYNTVRSLTPPDYPGAFIKKNNKKYIIYSSSLFKNKNNKKYPVGYILKKNKNGIYISTKKGIIVIRKFFMKNKIIEAQHVNF